MLSRMRDRPIQWKGMREKKRVNFLISHEILFFFLLLLLQPALLKGLLSIVLGLITCFPLFFASKMDYIMLLLLSKRMRALTTFFTKFYRMKIAFKKGERYKKKKKKLEELMKKRFTICDAADERIECNKSLMKTSLDYCSIVCLDVTIYSLNRSLYGTRYNFQRIA